MQKIIYDGLSEAEEMLDSIDHYPVHIPEGNGDGIGIVNHLKYTKKRLLKKDGWNLI